MTTFLSTDIIDFLLDDEGDVVVGPQGMVEISGPDAIAQMCAIALKLVLGEWFRDETRGVDWFTIFQKKYRAEDVREAVRAALADVPGVIQVISVTPSLDPEARAGTVEAVVSTAFGDLEISAPIGGISA